MNEAVSGVAPFGLADIRAGMAEVQGVRRGYLRWRGLLGRSPPPEGRRRRNQVADKLMNRPPLEVHLVAGHSMIAKDKIDKQALRAR